MPEIYDPKLKARLSVDAANRVRGINHVDEYWESPESTPMQTAVAYLREVSDALAVPDDQRRQGREERRHQRQLDGHRQPQLQLVDDRAPAAERLPQIPLGDVSQPLDVLNRQRLVQPVRAADRLPLLDGRLLVDADHLRDRIARDLLDQRERQDRHPEQDGHQQGEAAEDVGQHRRSRASSVVSPE